MEALSVLGLLQERLINYLRQTIEMRKFNESVDIDYIQDVICSLLELIEREV